MEEGEENVEESQDQQPDQQELTEENDDQEENVFVALGEHHDEFFEDHIYIQEDAQLCEQEYSKLWNDGFNDDDDYAEQDKQALQELD